MLTKGGFIAKSYFMTYKGRDRKAWPWTSVRCLEVCLLESKQDPSLWTPRQSFQHQVRSSALAWMEPAPSSVLGQTSSTPAGKQNADGEIFGWIERGWKEKDSWVTDNCSEEDLKEGMCFDVFRPSWSRAQPPVRILHQQLLQQVLSSGSNHGGERWIAAQNTPDTRGEYREGEKVRYFQIIRIIVQSSPSPWSSFHVTAKAFITEILHQRLFSTWPIFYYI